MMFGKVFEEKVKRGTVIGHISSKQQYNGLVIPREVQSLFKEYANITSKEFLMYSHL